MPDVSGVVGIGLAGGQGVRARPLTLKAPGHLRSKAAMTFLGRRLIRWVVQILPAGMRRHRLDFGKDLLPWLVRNGYRVQAHTVPRMGDLGNFEDYLAPRSPR